MEGDSPALRIGQAIRHGWLMPVMVGLVLIGPSPAEAGLVSAVQKILAGVLQLPLSTLVGTFTGPPVLGTVMGAANGLVTGTGLVLNGAFDLAASGVALAKMVAPYVLPFVF